MNALTALTANLEARGYRVATWSPGDGITRYRIVPSAESYDSAPSPWPSLTARGRREATVLVQAFLAGLDEGAAPLRRIQGLLSGRDWTADTINAVADELTAAGFAVRDSAETDDKGGESWED